MASSQESPIATLSESVPVLIEKEKEEERQNWTVVTLNFMRPYPFEKSSKLTGTQHRY